MKQIVRLFGCAMPLLILLAGCHDSEGNRVSMFDFWKGEKTADTQQADTTEAPAEQSDAPREAERDADKSETETTTKHRPEPSRAERRRPPRADRTAAPRRPRRSPPPHAIRPDALLVNDHTITVSDILEPLMPKLEQLSSQLPPEAYYRRVSALVRRQIIEEVAQHLIWRRARRQITEDMETNLDKAVDRMEKDRITREFNGRETMYQKYLDKHGKTRQEIRDRLRRSLIIDSYLRDRLLPLVDQPSKRELYQYYQAHIDEYTKTARREFLLIDIPINAFLDRRAPKTPQAEAEAKAKAREAIEAAAKALANGKDFADVAKKYSHGLHKDDGGAWGFITAPSEGKAAPLLGRWEKPSQALFELKEGETSEIIEAARSFFIVKVGRMEGGTTVPFQAAQPDIVESLRQQQFARLRSEFLQEELERSTIGSLDDFVAQVMEAVPRPT